ncbi:MAG: DUF29 family protein [Cytophagaceae bacterium]|nr:MAG: DUF29 family protein [Cytophagaceae bacterium]
MDELETLRKLIEEQDYSAALSLIDEMDEMAKDDKITKVESFLAVLLIHIIKQKAESRITSSWQRSINHALFGIFKSNKRRSAGGFYLSPDELKNAINESFSFSLKEASEEAFGGAYKADQLITMIDADQIKQEAFDRIMAYRP